MRLAVQENMLGEGTLADKFELAQNAGFDGIELNARGNNIFRERLPELRQALADGVIVSSACVAMPHFIGSFDADLRRDARAQLRQMLSVVAEVGGVGVVTPNAYAAFSRKLPPFVPPREDEDSRRILLETLAELGEHASSAGVTLFLEPLNRYEDFMVNTLADATELIVASGAPGLAVIADTFHMSIEESDIGAAIRRAGPLLGHVQLGDSNRLEPGAGHYDWAETLAALDDIGYDRWLAMECGLSEDPKEVLPRVSSLLKEVIGPNG